MHLPELALGASGFSRFGSELGQRMNLGEREISEYEAEAGAKLILDQPDIHMRGCAVRALRSPYSTNVSGAVSGTLYMIIRTHGNEQTHDAPPESDSRARKTPSAPGLTPIGETWLQWTTPSGLMTNRARSLTPSLLR